MGLVAEILSNGGTLPQLEELMKGKSKFFSRRNGLIISLFWFLFFVLIITPFWAILDVEEMAAMSGVVGVFGSIMIFLFSLFFLSKKPKEAPAYMAAPGEGQLGTGYAQGHHALPGHMQETADEYASPQPGGWRVPDTGDLVTPGSVTEGTTRLLQKEESND
jgi:hypothetical protein